MSRPVFLNLGILAHVDAGKTSLTKRLLYDAGVIDEIGSVDAGSTQTDSLALERRRGITIRSAVVSFALGDRAGARHGTLLDEIARRLSPRRGPDGRPTPARHPGRRPHAVRPGGSGSHRPPVRGAGRARRRAARRVRRRGAGAAPRQSHGHAILGKSMSSTGPTSGS